MLLVDFCFFWRFLERNFVTSSKLTNFVLQLKYLIFFNTQHCCVEVQERKNGPSYWRWVPESKTFFAFHGSILFLNLLVGIFWKFRQCAFWKRYSWLRSNFFHQHTFGRTAQTWEKKTKKLHYALKPFILKNTSSGKERVNWRDLMFSILIQNVVIQAGTWFFSNYGNQIYQ